jgi:hypothetical protein
VFKYQDRKLYKECTEERGLFGKIEFWSNFDSLYLGNSNSQTNHLHITFRDLNEEYKEESIHQHCMKNEHPHTKTKQTLFITLEPLVSVVDF